MAKMDKDKKYIMDLMIDYFKLCKKTGYMNFMDFCETDIYKEEHYSLVHEMEEHCNHIANLLCM